MAKLRLVGAVGIKVRPDTTEFRQEVDRAVQRIPDNVTIDINAELDTNGIKRKLDEVERKESGRVIQLKVGVDYDTLQAAKRQVQGLLKEGETIRIPVKMDKDGLDKALAKINRLQQNAKVSVNYNEDQAGYESILAKIKQIQRQKLEKTVTFKTDNASLKREAAKYEKLLRESRTITITHRNDRDSLTAAVKQIDEAMAKLKEKTLIVPEMDEKALQALRDKLDTQLASKPVVMKMTEDKKGYERVLARIQELQAKNAEIDFKFKTDDASLEAAAKRIQKKLDALKEPITLKYNYETNSIKDALAIVDKELEKYKKFDFELKANLDEKGLLEAKKKLEKSLSKSDFKVEVDSSNLDAMKAKAKELEGMLTELAVKDVVLKVKNNEEDIRRAKDQLDDLVKKREAKIKADALTWEAAMQLSYASRARDVPFYVHINQKSLAIAESTLQALAGINVLRESGDLLESLITKFDTISLKTGFVATALGSIADVALYAVTALLPLGEGILNLTGLLAYAPVALSGLAAAVLVNVAGFQDFKAAAEGNAKALAKLPPAAREAAKALNGTWEKIQQPVQNAFWEGMGKSIQAFAKDTIPVLSKGLTSVADDIGKFDAGILDSFHKIAQNGELQKMFAGLEGFFQNAAKGTEPFFDAINRIGLRGAEILPKFGGYLTDMANRFDAWIKKSDEAGKITGWMEAGVQSLQDLWTMGGGVVKMFQGLTMAAKTAGAAGLGPVADEFNRIGELMKGEPFQSRMATIFDGARSGASALNVGLKDLGTTIGEASLFVANLLSQLGKLGGQSLSGVANLIGNITFQDGILRGLQGMSTMLGDLQVGFYNLGSVIGNMSSIAGTAFTNLSPIINNIISLLDVVVGNLGPSISNMIPNLMGLVDGLITTMSGPITLASEALSKILDFINGLPGPLAQVVTGLVGFLLLAGKIGPMFEAKPGGLLEKIKYDFGQADTARGKFSVGLKGLGAGLLSAVGGPWGIAIGVLTTGLSLAGQASMEAKSRIDQYTASIDANTGALDKNGLAGAAKNLMDEGGFWNDRMRGAKKTQEAIDLLGLSFQKTAAIAANGGQDYDDLMRKLDMFPGVSGKSGASLHDFAQAMDISDEQASKLSKGDIVYLKQRLGEVNSEAATGRENFSHLNDEMSKVPADAAAQKVEDFNRAMQTYNDKTATADARTRALKQALDILNGKQPSVEEAQLKVNDAMRSAEGTLTQVGDKMILTGGIFRDAEGNIKDFNGVIDKTTGTISTVTAAGAELYRGTKNVTDGVLETATAMKDAHEPTEKIAEFLAKSREQYIKMGEAAHLNGDEVAKAYDHMIGANPHDLLTTVTAVGTEDAKKKIQDYKGTLDEVAAYKAVAQIMGDNTVLGVKLADSYGNLAEFDKVVATATANLNPEQADLVRQRIINDLINLAKTDPTVKAHLDPAILDREREAVLRRLDDLARQKPTPEVRAQTEDAKNQLLTIQGLLSGIKDKDINVRTFYSEFGKPPVHGAGQTQQSAFEAQGGLWMNNVKQFAQGGFYNPRTAKFFAGGGIEQHVAQIARPSSVYRVWAEPETGGEAYIPLASSKRERSTQILDQVANQFGYKLTPVQAFAEGGVVAGGNSRNSGLSITIDTFNQNANDTVEDVGRGLMRQVRNAGMAGIMDGI